MPYGTSLPSASERKSYTFTQVSSPFACHSRPLFLKVPISSFFLQSTEMIGSPRCSNWLHFLLICSNWASRSGCEVPSIVFLLARKENPRSCKISARADFLIWCPLAVSASTRCARDLLVHWTKLIGSPLGCSSCSKSESSVASVSTSFFMPPPDRRMRSPGRYPSPASSSFKPRFTVLIETPASRATWLTLSRLCASAARYCLHCFSLSIWRICWYSCSIESFSMRSAWLLYPSLSSYLRKTPKSFRRLFTPSLVNLSLHFSFFQICSISWSYFAIASSIKAILSLIFTYGSSPRTGEKGRRT